MALRPKISLSLGNKCNLVTFREETDPYVALTNETGWGSGNIDASDISSATVEIINLENTIVATYILTGLYSAAVGYPTPSAFNIASDASWTQPDGIYKIKYKIVDVSLNEYFNELTHELFICNLCNCKENLVKKLINACDSKTVTKLKEQVDQLEIFIYGIQSAFSCADFDTADAILTAASTYCQTLSDCGCGCGGC